MYQPTDQARSGFPMGDIWNKRKIFSFSLHKSNQGTGNCSAMSCRKGVSLLACLTLSPTPAYVYTVFGLSVGCWEVQDIQFCLTTKLPTPNYLLGALLTKSKHPQKFWLFQILAQYKAPKKDFGGEGKMSLTTIAFSTKKLEINWNGTRCQGRHFHGHESKWIFVL